jgi:hypothetical protein
MRSQEAKALKESYLQSKIIKKLKEKYGENIDVTNNHGSAMSMAGTPDIHVCFYGLFVSIEVKLPERIEMGTKKKQTEPTELQRKRLNKQARAGAVSLVCRNDQDLIEMFERLYIFMVNTQLIDRIRTAKVYLKREYFPIF